jgi:hypothetical protein
MKKCSKCKIEKSKILFGKNQGYCKECRSIIDKEKRLNNSQYFKDWWVNNRDKKREYHLNDKSKRHHVHKWRDLLSNTLQQLHTSKSTTTQESLKYSALELKEHLDRLGMDWKNDHIDHKIPVSWFNPLTPPHIVNDLRNLQPLSGEENRIKLNRFGTPIESSYIIIIKEYIKEEYLNNNYELFKL